MTFGNYSYIFKPSFELIVLSVVFIVLMQIQLQLTMLGRIYKRYTVKVKITLILMQLKWMVLSGKMNLS